MRNSARLPPFSRLTRRLFRALLGLVPALLAGASTVSLPARAPETITDQNAFRPGDRWAVIGDSITHTGTYHAWVHLFYLTRFPARSLEVLNTGIAGDTAAGGLRRFTWDILPQRGSIATIAFGMNDVSRGLYASASPTPEQLAARRAAVQTLIDNDRTLITRLREAGHRVILLTPSLFDDEARLPAPSLHGVNAALGECAAALRTLARDTGCGLVDFHAPLLALNRRLQQADPAFTLTGPDRIHPGIEGHFVMAYLFLKARSAPAMVSRLVLDATELRVTAAENGRIAHLNRVDGGLSFTWTEDALPFPLDTSFGRAPGWVPFTQDLNQESLQITGLPSGIYTLRIDGRPIRAVTAAELSAGLNLATETTAPQYRQAAEVLALVKEYAHLSAETVRNLALVEHQTTPADLLPAAYDVVRPFVDARFATFQTNIPSANLLRIYTLYATEKPREAASRERIASLQARARQAAQPRPHTYEILPVRQALTPPILSSPIPHTGESQVPSAPRSTK
jgi:lysophospholipase L1-like esterase